MRYLLIYFTFLSNFSFAQEYCEFEKTKDVILISHYELIGRTSFEILKNGSEYFEKHGIEDVSFQLKQTPSENQYYDEFFIGRGKNLGIDIYLIIDKSTKLVSDVTIRPLFCEFNNLRSFLEDYFTFDDFGIAYEQTELSYYGHEEVVDSNLTYWSAIKLTMRYDAPKIDLVLIDETGKKIFKQKDDNIKRIKD